MKTKIEREKQTIELMIRLYSKKMLHQTELSPEMDQLLQYAHRRLNHCKYGNNKQACKRCPIHCYAPKEREEIRRIMRWCGPRMMLYHPWLTLKHFF